MENPITRAQFLIIMVSDGVYSIPLLINPESVKEQFG